MVDTLTKYAHFIPCKESITAIELAYLVLDRLIRHYGILESFITDRDKLFTSNFQKSLIGQIGIKHKLLTVFYLETDGQTKRTNQLLEVYLRHYVNYAQNNQVLLLLIVQLALNNNILETTKESLFFLNYGKTPNLFMELRTLVKANKAIIIVGELQKAHITAQDTIRHSQQRT